MNKLNLKIDIDEKINDDYLNYFNLVYKNFKKLGLNITQIKVYDTRKGQHLYISSEHETIKSDYAVLFLQLVLGSDRKREFFNLERLEANNGKTKNWNILFIKKYNYDLKKWFSEKRNKVLENKLKKIIENINKRSD